jgi:hypothetical protein
MRKSEFFNGIRPKRRFSLDVHLVIMRLSEWRSLSAKTPAADNNASHQRGVRFADHVQKPHADSMFSASVISWAIANDRPAPHDLHVSEAAFQGTSSSWGYSARDSNGNGGYGRERARPVAHTVQGLRMRRGGGEALVAIRRPENSVT